MADGAGEAANDGGESLFVKADAVDFVGEIESEVFFEGGFFLFKPRAEGVAFGVGAAIGKERVRGKEEDRCLFFLALCEADIEEDISIERDDVEECSEEFLLFFDGVADEKAFFSFDDPRSSGFLDGDLKERESAEAVGFGGGFDFFVGAHEELMLGGKDQEPLSAFEEVFEGEAAFEAFVGALELPSASVRFSGDVQSADDTGMFGDFGEGASGIFVVFGKAGAKFEMFFEESFGVLLCKSLFE